MDRSRKANREGNEVTLQHQSARDAARVQELSEEKVVQLQAAIEVSKQTPKGLADLQRRTKAFGECVRSAEESASQFYDRLRHWVDRTMPQTKLPLHPPRQNAPESVTRPT